MRIGILCFMASFCLFFRVTSEASEVTFDQKQIIILSKNPIAIDASGVEFAPPKKLKVVGTSAAVCLVLHNDVSMSPEMDVIYQRKLEGATILTTLVLEDNRHIDLGYMGQGWEYKGVLGARNELSVCSSLNSLDTTPNIKGYLKKIIIKTSKPLAVLGAYLRAQPTR